VIVLAIFIGVVFLVSLLSRRIGSSLLTAPMIFTAAGALTFALPAARSVLEIERQTFLQIAELGLVMLLFTDATRVSLKMLGARGSLPLRLLSTGMLLTIGLGAVFAMVIFGGLTWLEAGILAAILAPTDAGLGQVIVTSPLVPERIRQALNVEAGLNDGMAVPFMMFFIALAAAAQSGAGSETALTRVLVEQLGYGAMVGIAIGLAGGWLLDLARRKEWMSGSFMQLGVVALPLFSLMAAHATAASAFIAAFVAGLAAQVGFRNVGQHSVEFTEEWGQLLNFFVFFLFGMLAARAAGDIGLPFWLYALASLTVVRMLPVALALRGTGLSPATVLFMGWFGPRGLASIVLGLVYLSENAALTGESTIRLAVVATVLLSIVAHGVSVMPGIKLYARASAKLPPGAPDLAVDSGGAADRGNT
jgi:NhaP-type Na+/H+ or K+/H+ antiporter